MRVDPELTAEHASIEGDLERPPDKVLAFVASMPLLYGDDVAPATSYACPMHPEVTSSEPGTCPKCGMQLLPVRSEQPTGRLLHVPDAPGGHVLGAGNVPEVRHEAGALRRAAGAARGCGPPRA